MPITLLFAFIMLFRGCTVYKSMPVSLEQAVKNETKVKVKTKSGKKLKFKRIEIEKGNYYGVKYFQGKMEKIYLEPKFIDSINEKDKTLSIILSIGILVTVNGGLFLLAISDVGSGGYVF